MTPYGIVYSDNIISLNECKKQWLKYEKTFYLPSFLIGYAVIAALIILGNILLILFDVEMISDYYYMVITEMIFSFIIYLFSVRKIKESFFKAALFSKEKKQVVLRENSVVFTAPYRQSEYFYDELDFIIETENTIMFFIDSKYSYPTYVSKNSTEKGDFDLFKKILAEKSGSKYRFLGGNVK